MSANKIVLTIEELKELRSYLNLIIPDLNGDKKIEWENLHSCVSNTIGDGKLESIEICPFDKIYIHWAAMKWTKLHL